jgi:hypothetical protein
MDKIRCTIIATHGMFALMATIACSSDHDASDHDRGFAGHPAIAGMTYEAAKTELIRAGWRPIPANCSEKNICYEDGVLASNLETMKPCAEFRNESRRIEICLGIVPDRAHVESVREMPQDRKVHK